MPLQLVYSGKVDSAKEQQLQRLCAKVTSTVDLAGARVKVSYVCNAHTFYESVVSTLQLSACCCLQPHMIGTTSVTHLPRLLVSR